MTDNNKMQANLVGDNKMQANLTEQWKKGELPSGYYYVKNEFGNIFPTDYSEEYDSINDVVVKDFWTEVSDIVEVLAPVPSYEQWQAKLEENTKLKELLKDARNVLKMVDTYSGNNDSINGFLIVERINQALGEDKQATETSIAYNELKESFDLIKSSLYSMTKVWNSTREDCRTLAQKLLQAKPELREWLEINFKEYL